MLCAWRGTWTLTWPDVLNWNFWRHRGKYNICKTTIVPVSIVPLLLIIKLSSWQHVFISTCCQTYLLRPDVTEGVRRAARPSQSDPDVFSTFKSTGSVTGGLFRNMKVLKLEAQKQPHNRITFVFTVVSVYTPGTMEPWNHGNRRVKGSASGGDSVKHDASEPQRTIRSGGKDSFTCLTGAVKSRLLIHN